MVSILAPAGSTLPLPPPVTPVTKPPGQRTTGAGRPRVSPYPAFADRTSRASPSPRHARASGRWGKVRWAQSAKLDLQSARRMEAGGSAMRKPAGRVVPPFFSFQAPSRVPVMMNPRSELTPPVFVLTDFRSGTRAAAYPWSEGSSVEQIWASYGLVSEDRNNKATLPLTTPRCSIKSSAKDLSLRIVKLQYTGKDDRLFRPPPRRRPDAIHGPRAYSYTTTTS